MSKDRSYDLRDETDNREREQSHFLLAQGVGDDYRTPEPQSPHFPQSSLSHNASNGFPRSPRTVNRVRFDVGETYSGEHALNDLARTPSREGGELLEAEDDSSDDDLEIRRSSAGPRAPLLTGVEAPGVMVAEDLDFNAEGLLENARPKSGLM